MAMPRDLVLVRHGQSEANVVNGEFKHNPEAAYPPGFLERHDTHMRLSTQGRDQARKTGQWVLEHFQEGFDKFFVSPLVRTCETAGEMNIDELMDAGVGWELDDRLRERDWGEFSGLSPVQQKLLYPASVKLREQQEWYWCPPGGENLATGVRSRFKDFLGTAHRELESQRVIAVTHGELIGVARFVLERMTPDEWVKEDERKDRKRANCMVVHYTREDPETGDIAPNMRWMRAICPWDETKSWNEGEWITIPPRATYSSEALLRRAAEYPNLLVPETV